jgi:hypothetical protein
MANHRIYQYTALARPLDPAHPTNRAVIILIPLAALLGGGIGWLRHADALKALQEAFLFALILFGSWALARELDPDDHPAAFISLTCGMLVAWLMAEPAVLIVFVTFGLVRIVNRSTGLMASKADSIALTMLSIVVIYGTGSPLYGAVAALAFMLDGSLREPLPRQWLFGLVCLGATIVYMVDHDIAPGHVRAPDSLVEWLAVLFLLIFALDAMLLKRVKSVGDATGQRLDVNRVRGGMAVGLVAALQGIQTPANVAIIVAVIAGLGIGMVFRKRFRAPAAG